MRQTREQKRAHKRLMNDCRTAYEYAKTNGYHIWVDGCNVVVLTRKVVRSERSLSEYITTPTTVHNCIAHGETATTLLKEVNRIASNGVPYNNAMAFIMLPIVLLEVGGPYHER